MFHLLLLLPLICYGEGGGAPEPAGLSSSHFRAVAERSSQLAAQLSSILDRVREERIRQLDNKIERREEERDNEGSDEDETEVLDCPLRTVLMPKIRKS